MKGDQTTATPVNEEIASKGFTWNEDHNAWVNGDRCIAPGKEENTYRHGTIENGKINFVDQEANLQDTLAAMYPQAEKA